MKQAATEEDIEKVKVKAIEQGHEPKVLYGVEGLSLQCMEKLSKITEV